MTFYTNVFISCSSTILSFNINDNILNLLFDFLLSGLTRAVHCELTSQTSKLNVSFDYIELNLAAMSTWVQEGTGLRCNLPGKIRKLRDKLSSEVQPAIAAIAACRNDLCAQFQQRKLEESEKEMLLHWKKLPPSIWDP
jgi:hypothetical protein